MASDRLSAVAGSLSADAGNLPAPGELAQSGQLANFSFGQGKLLAAPVQVAAMMNTVASGGIYRTPFFAEATLNEQTAPRWTGFRTRGGTAVMTEETAESLRKMLEQVVERVPVRMRPVLSGGAGGKTGTAQTGQFTRRDRALKLVRGFLPGRKAPLDHRGDAGRPDRAGGVQRSRLCPPVRRAERRGSEWLCVFCLLFWPRYVTIYLYLYVCYPNLTIKGAFSSMAVIEIVGGVILLVVSVVIFALTLMQHTHGQGLSGAINGSADGANNARLTPADQMLAKVTRIAGIIFFVVAILACVFASRLA